MKPQATSGSTPPSKHRFSKWEKEWKRRRLLAVLVVVVILAAGGVVGAGLYVTKIKPWHQATVKVNDQVFDMGYFVKMLRVDSNVNPYASYYNSYPSYYASYIVQTIQRNELVRQRAEELGIEVADDDIEVKFQSLFGFDPESTDDDDEFNQQLEDFLKERNISQSDLEELVVLPAILQEKVQEVMGNEEYPEENLYDHAQVHAMLLGTKDDAEKVMAGWSDGIGQLVDDYSPSRYYPDDDSIEWLPQDIESSAFDDYAFDDESLDSGVSQPIPDTAYTTTGGYWLVMIYEPEEAEEHEEEGLYIKAILLDSQEEAEELKAEIEADGDFGMLAEENSLDTASSSNGGDMGWLSLDDIGSKFGEDNLAVIEDIEVNKLSEPLYDEDVSKQSGYWVIEVLDRVDRTLIEEHRDTYISVYYSDWLSAEIENGKEEGRIEDYIVDDNDKISWAFAHI